MRELRIIILEDDQLDFELAQAELSLNLTEFKCLWKWTGSRADFLEALASFEPDIVLSDYNLPGFNGLEALKATQESRPLLPFIFVTGELQEEKAAETIRSGAWEYVVKDRLFRLPIAIRNTLKFKEERIQRQKVEEENYRLSLVANSTTNSVKLFDSSGHITWVNPAFTRLTGYTLDELKGKRINDFFEYSLTNSLVIDFITARIKAGEPFKDVEFELHNKDGDSYWVSSEFQPVRNNAGEIIQFVLIENDITDKRRAEFALTAREKRFRSLVEQSPLPIIEWGLDSSINEWNTATERLYGCTKEQIAGSYFSRMFVPEDTSESIEKIWKDLIDNKPSFMCIVRSTNVSGKSIVCALYNSALTNEHGEVVGVVSILEDITERREAEENLLNKNEELTKINAELDRFVYSASHDLRAPVTSMLGLIEVAKLEKDPSEVFEYLDKQKKALKKMDEFIHEIVNYSRNGRLSVLNERIDLKNLVEDIYDQYNYLENAKHIVKSVSVEGDTPFFSDKQRVSMVLSNLISNSLKYADLKKDEPTILVKAIVENQQVVVEVIDNGEGIRDDLKDKIFEMFYRATKNSTGSGLGLYIVKEVLSKLEGTINVSSNFGQGTHFIITLPNSK